MLLAEEGMAKVPGWSLDTLQEEKKRAMIVAHSWLEDSRLRSVWKYE